MTPGDPRFAWAIVGAAWVLGLLLVIAGVIVVVRRALLMKGRIEAYGDLPIFTTIERSADVIARASRRAQHMPDLLERLQRSRDEILIARNAVFASARSVTNVETALWLLLGAR